MGLSYLLLVLGASPNHAAATLSGDFKALLGPLIGRDEYEQDS